MTASRGTGSSGSWQPLLRDHAFLGFVAVNVGITFLALAVPTALPVFLVKVLGLPAWSPGAALALNAVLVALSAPVMMSAISGRRRRNILMASQAMVIAALAVLLLVHLLPVGAAVALVLIAILPLAACEVMQGAVVPAVVTESAAPLTVGRYTSAYQVTFSIADIICPAVVTPGAARRRGRAVAAAGGGRAARPGRGGPARPADARPDPADRAGRAGAREPGGAPAQGRRGSEPGRAG